MVFPEYLNFTELTRKHAFDEFSGEKCLENTLAMIGYRTLSNKNMKKHVENAHTEEKCQNTFDVTNF